MYTHGHRRPDGASVPLTAVTHSHHPTAPWHWEGAGRPYVSTNPKDRFDCYPILQIRKLSLSNRQNRDLNPGSLSAALTLRDTVWHYVLDRGSTKDITKGRGASAMGPARRDAGPRGPDGRQGQGRGNSRTWRAPQAWLGRLDLTPKGKGLGNQFKGATGIELSSVFRANGHQALAAGRRYLPGSLRCRTPSSFSPGRRLL